MAPSRKAVHFGGGNIGRGFMAPIFHRDNYGIVFVDVVDDLVNRLNGTPQYKVNELDNHGEVQKVSVITNYRAINSMKNPDAVVDEVATADIVTCAVGPNVLKLIAPHIAKGIQAREATLPPVAVIACENMVRATDRLKGFVTQALDAKDKNALGQKAIFSNSAVDRIVPTDQVPDSLDVKVETFFEWCIEQGPFGANRPVLQEAHFVKDLDYYIQRKLWTVNAGHAITAYLARYRKITFIHEAIGDPDIESAVRQALKETSELILSMYDVSPQEQETYVNTVIGRFGNPALRDSPVRVGRGPLRKMGLEDRLVGPANGQARANRSYKGLLKGMEMALRFQDVTDDAESKKMAGYIRDLEPRVATRKILEDQMREGEVLSVGQNIHAELYEEIIQLVTKIKAEALDSARASRDNSPSGGPGSAGGRKGSPTGRPGSAGGKPGFTGGESGSAAGSSGSLTSKQTASGMRQVSAAGAQATGGSKQVSARGKQAAGGSKQVSVGGKQVSATGSQAAASPKKVSAREKQVPAVGRQAPAAEKQTSAGGKRAPVAGKQASGAGKQALAGGKQVPIGGQVRLTNGSTGSPKAKAGYPGSNSYDASSRSTF